MNKNIFGTAIEGVQLAVEPVGGESDQKPADGDKRPEPKSHRAAPFGEGDKPDQTDRHSGEPNWVEKGTFWVLILTLIAAGYAGYQAGRLADLTKTAIDDARTNSDRQDTNTKRALDIAARSADAASKQADAATVATKTAQQSMVASQRAWIGPTNAALNQLPVAGNELQLTLTYLNTGHEPGIDLVTNESWIIAMPDTKVDAVISAAAQQCPTASPAPGDVAYPTGLSNNYSLTMKVAGASINQDLVDGRTVIYLYGCFTYRTVGEAHHTSFCYFFNSTVTKIDHMNICPIGQKAD